MDPYETLGVPASATPADVEAAYRSALRAWHPDLHQGRGPEAVAEAEARTRALNEAIARVRAGWRPVDGSAAPGGRDGPIWYDEWGRAHRPVDDGWFTADTRVERDPVPCPFCDQPFASLRDYQIHLTDQHRLRNVGIRRRTDLGPLTRTLGLLRYVPLWLICAVALALAWVLPPVVLPLLLGAVALTLWVQVSPRFKVWRR